MTDFWTRPSSHGDLGRQASGGHPPTHGAASYADPLARDPFTPAPTAAYARQHNVAGAMGGMPAPQPRFAPPSEPPARVGSAVAALVCAMLTLLCPVLFLALGFPVLALLVNVPAIAFGIAALARLNDPMEVERYIRYTWACILVYLGLMAVILIAAIMVVLSL
ncbi:hypothetical protein [Streptomonospora wellingtoniae]|uniref:DUF4190 domain-containing protein n=1 Tax=Streptomonospora wellingtoniae TaxID=3075544 RepID=A0ABU2KY65_9ACTN|nr:hypothetical protein [Streptomonospora sp. DSM 45055]MDT0304188.1 hypothetical protein [Streptomonospora sp. DSM 45055]